MSGMSFDDNHSEEGIILNRGSFANIVNYKRELSMGGGHGSGSSEGHQNKGENANGDNLTFAP